MWPFKTEEEKPTIEIRLPEPNPEHVRIEKAAALLRTKTLINDYLAESDDATWFTINAHGASLTPRSLLILKSRYLEFLTFVRDDVDAELTDLGVPLS